MLKVTICVTLAYVNAFKQDIDITAPVKATALADWMLSRGISAATTKEIARFIGVPTNQVRQRMKPLVKRGEIITPARGLWIPVSPEYREWGGPEALTYIDALMSFLDANYYVGWMSAATLLGASHHASQVFQVATSKTVANRTIGRSDLMFYKRSNVVSLPTFKFKTNSGFARVSTRAATMLSVTNDMSLTAGPNNAANIIIELSETNEQYLSQIVQSVPLFPISALRRLGWILENYTDEQDLSALIEVSQASETKLSKLSMYDSYSGHVDKNWSLDINTRIEPDV